MMSFWRYIKLYLYIQIQTVKSKMSYKADFLISILGMIATNICGFISFWLVFQNFPLIGGFNLHETIFLYGFSLIAITPCQCILENNWMLSLNIFKGDFVRYCFRPINIFFYYISEDFDLKGIGQFVSGIVLLLYSISHMELHVTLGFLLILLIMLFSASLFPIAIMTAVSAISFRVIHIGGLMLLVNKLLDYSKYPVKIYGPVLQFIFTLIFPLAYIAYYPSIPIIRQCEINAFVILTPVFGVICLFLSYKFWITGALKYNGTGS